jgi:hypothetical protein
MNLVIELDLIEVESLVKKRSLVIRTVINFFSMSPK